MKIAVIGASGRAGSRIVSEAVSRGHQVTAIARHPDKIAAANGVTVKQGDVNDPAALAGLLSGHDAVVSAVRFSLSDRDALFDAVRRSGVKRYVVVGGAGSLQVAPGRDSVDDPSFNPAHRNEALAGREFLKALREQRDLDWTFLSPSALFFIGERTGKFRLGNDELLKTDSGESKISFEDYAIALVDELETPRHIKQRFTVGY